MSNNFTQYTDANNEDGQQYWLNLDRVNRMYWLEEQNKTRIEMVRVDDHVDTFYAVEKPEIILGVITKADLTDADGNTWNPGPLPAYEEPPAPVSTAPPPNDPSKVKVGLTMPPEPFPLSKSASGVDA